MSKQIMIIDDSKVMREIMGYALTSGNYDFIEATDGDDALKKLDGKAEISLFICDMNMPNMDGLTMLKKLKNDDSYVSYRSTPFIMLTTESGEEIRTKGKDAGVKAWLEKPFRPYELLDTIKQLLL